MPAFCQTTRLAVLRQRAMNLGHQAWIGDVPNGHDIVNTPDRTSFAMLWALSYLGRLLV